MVGDYGLDGGDFFFVGDPERGTAAARGHDVRVVDLEAGALHALDIVHDRAVDVREAGAVDEDPQTVIGEDLVAVALGVEGERVLEPLQPPPRTPTRRPAVSTSATGRRETREPSRRPSR